MPENRIRLIVIEEGVTLSRIARDRDVRLAVLRELNPTIRDADASLKPGTVVWVPGPAGWRDEPQVHVDRIEALRRRVAPRLWLLDGYGQRLNTVLGGRETTLQNATAFEREYGFGKVVNALNVEVTLAEARRRFADPATYMDRHLRALEVRVLEKLGERLPDARRWADDTNLAWRYVRVPPQYLEAVDADHLGGRITRRSFYNEQTLTCWDRHLDGVCAVVADLTKELEALYSGCKGGPTDLAQYQIISEYLQVLMYLRRRLGVDNGPLALAMISGREEVAKTHAEVRRLLGAAREKALDAPALLCEVVLATSRDAFDRVEKHLQDLEQKVVADFRAEANAPLKAGLLTRLDAWRTSRDALKQRLQRDGQSQEQLAEVGRDLERLQRRLLMLTYLAWFAWHDWKVRKADFDALERWMASAEALYGELKDEAQRLEGFADRDDFDGFLVRREGYDALLLRVREVVLRYTDFSGKLLREVAYLVVACALTGGAAYLAAVWRLSRVGTFALQVFVFTAVLEAEHAAFEGQDVTVLGFTYELVKNALIFGALTKFHGFVRGLEKGRKVTNPLLITMIELVGSYLVLTTAAAPFLMLEVYHTRGTLPGRDDWFQLVVSGAVMVGILKVLSVAAKGLLARLGGSSDPALVRLEQDLRAFDEACERQQARVRAAERELLRETQAMAETVRGYQERARRGLLDVARLLEAAQALRRRLEAMQQALAPLRARSGAQLAFFTEQDLLMLGDWVARQLALLDTLVFHPPVVEGVRGYLTTRAGTPAEVLARDALLANVTTVQARAGELANLPQGQQVRVGPVPDPASPTRAPVAGVLELAVRVEAPDKGVNVDARVLVLDPRGEGRPEGEPAPPPEPRSRLLDVVPELRAERLQRLASVQAGVRDGLARLRQHLGPEAEGTIGELHDFLPEDPELVDALTLASKLQSKAAIEGFARRARDPGPRALVDWARTRGDGLEPRALEGIFSGELRQLAQKLNMTPEAIEAELTAGTRKTGTRDPLKSALREEGHFRNFIELGTLRAFGVALRKTLGTGQQFAPDVVLGEKRGGALLGGLVVEGDPALRPKFEVFERTKDDAAMLQRMHERLHELVVAGKRRFLIVDCMMGGRSARHYRDLVQKFLRDHKDVPDLRVLTVWLRETIGFEEDIGFGGRVALEHGKTKPGYVKQYEQIEVAVPWVLGDDMPVLCNDPATLSPADLRLPIRIFDTKGEVVDVWRPRPGETTREMFFRKLWEEGRE